MSGTLDSPPDESSPDGPGSASPTPGRGRRLRARRAAPPLRLIEAGEGGGGSVGVRLELTSDAPMAFMRLGGKDLDDGMSAINDRTRPSAVITGLGESRETISRARHLASARGTPWLGDPLLFRTGLEGYRTRSSLHDLDYTPGRDGDPYSPDEFADEDLTRRVGRSVVGAQLDLLAAGAIGGAFVVNRIDDPWLEVNQRLLRVASEAAAAWDVPLIAALPLRMSGFDDLESQRLLVRALMARRPAAWLLMADGLSEDSGVDRILAGLRLALALQAASAPVILARAGDLRRLAWSVGIAGAEFGLGRWLRFAVPDFRKPSRGPGPTPGPRMELPSLVRSLPFTQASRVACRRAGGRGRLPVRCVRGRRITR